MKKLFSLLTLVAFLATSSAFAAPAQNAKQGGGTTKKVAKTTKATSKTTKKTATKQSKKAGTNKQANKGKKATSKTASKAPQQSILERLQPREAQREAQEAKLEDAKKLKSKQRAEDRIKEFGLMPSELDSMSHNIFHADSAAIRGARDTESALRYLPFVTIINTAGFGSQFDLRGQGRLSANGVKLYINGVPSNPVDTYHSPMPINTILPQLTQEVSVSPGGGAVLYGSGTKGGTIDIITSQRSNPYFLVGGGYTNTIGTKTNSFNAFAQASEDLGKKLKVNAGLGYNQIGGPREDDSQMQGQAVLGASYIIGWGHSISLDADAFYGKAKTTPYNSLIDSDTIDTMIREYSGMKTYNQTMQAGYWEAARYVCVSGSLSNPPIEGTHKCAQDLYNFSPSKDDRNTKGHGLIETTQIRATGKLGWEAELTRKLKINVDALYSLNSMKYDKYQMNLPYFVLGYQDPNNPLRKGYNWFLPRPTKQSNDESDLYIWNDASKTGLDLSDGQRSDWHFFDQSGSKFDDNKFALKAKVDWKHDGGELIFGISSLYEMSRKNQKSHLRQAIVDGNTWGGIKGAELNSNEFRTLIVDIEDKTDINVFTNAAFVLENYRFNRYFSLLAGMRYELKNYDIKIKDTFNGKKLKFENKAGNNQAGEKNKVDFANYSIAKEAEERTFADSVKKNFGSLTFELAPVFRYSNTGSIYARGEYGYVAPPAWAMLRRVGVVEGARTAQDIFGANGGGDTLDFNFGFQKPDIQSETYYTAELGWKEMVGTRRVPLGFTNLTLNALFFSANVFYTQSQNEFYFTGDTWSGMTFDTYEKSRRIGAELAFEQYLFGGALGLNESFTYIKAQKFDCDKNPFTAACDGEKGWQAMPYTYDYKATFGANVNVAGWLEVIDVSVNVWLQNSLYGNQQVYATKMQVGDRNKLNTALGICNNGNGADICKDKLVFTTIEESNVKLKPYIISDFGVSVGLNKNMGVITVGIKNIFDTFYYDYYNNDRSAVVNENRYVIGRGRTVFLEGTFRY